MKNSIFKTFFISALLSLCAVSINAEDSINATALEKVSIQPTNPIDNFINLRKNMRGQFDWITVDYSFEDFLNNNKDIKLNYTINNFNLYCLKYSELYQKKILKKYKLSELSKNIQYSCAIFGSLLNQHPAYFNIDNTKAIEKIIEAINAQYLYIFLINPFFQKMQRLEELETSYNKSILGLLGIDLKNSYLIIQILSVLAFALGLGAFIKTLSS